MGRAGNTELIGGPGASAAADGALAVTGAAGFIGSHLSAALLRRGRHVVGIDNFDPFYGRTAKLANVARVHAASAEPPDGNGESPATDALARFRLIEGDICDAEFMRELFLRQRPACVVHLAALAGVRPSMADPVRFALVNIDGLVNVLEAARASGCRHVVFASSSSVYGNNSRVPFGEDDPVEAPISPYAVTKRAGELVCRAYAEMYGMRIAALRFFTVYGPAQRPDLAISAFMRAIDAGQDVRMFGDGRSSRDYTYIDDVLAGVLAALDRVTGAGDSSSAARGGTAGTSAGAFFRIYNLGSDHPIPLCQMIDAIAQVIGKPARINRQPMQPGDVERTWADLRRSRAELGYRPTVDFSEGLRRQWEWLRRSSCGPGA